MTVEGVQPMRGNQPAVADNSEANSTCSLLPGEANAISCPACGGENTSDAVFCANPACHKALGEMRYVLEELKKEAHWHETLAEKTVAFIGKPHFVIAHVAWFVVWAALNSGLFAFVRQFDEYPYVLLGIILAAEAIFLTGFILISSNRQAAHADKRAELDYEASVRTYRHIREIDSRLEMLLNRLENLDIVSASRQR
jgi:uncharacterized membrane protein